MKKALITLFILSGPFVLFAEDIAHLPGGLSMDRGFLTGSATILLFYLIATLILGVIKSIQDYRLKSKLIEKGVPENVVEQFLQPTNKDGKRQAIKWFMVLAALGLGLAIINFTQPLGFHSAAIMAFCLALGFLGYYYFIRTTEK